MSADNPEIFWDPTQEQLNLNRVVSHAALLSGGWRCFATDCETVQNACVRIYRQDQRQRWFLALVFGDVIVASALCFSSASLAEIVREFQTVAEVLT